MSKSRVCLFVMFVCLVLLSITPMLASAQTFATSQSAGFGASFAAAAHIGPVSVAQVGAMGNAQAAAVAPFGVTAGALTIGPGVAFATGNCAFPGVGSAQTFTFSFPTGFAIGAATGC